MYEAFKIAHVSTKQVKSSKVYIIVFAWVMKNGETIKDMVQRFTTIVYYLSKKFNNVNLILKVLYSLTIEW